MGEKVRGEYRRRKGRVGEKRGRGKEQDRIGNEGRWEGWKKKREKDRERKE